MGIRRDYFWNCGLYSNTVLFISHSFFSFYKEIQCSISLDIFIILLLEDIQGLHLVLEGSSYMEAISKSQNIHAETLVNIFQAYSSYAPFGTHQNPSKSIKRLPTFPCIYKNNSWKSVCLQKNSTLTGLLIKSLLSPHRELSWFLVTWPNIKIAVIKWNCEGQMRYKS